MLNHITEFYLLLFFAVLLQSVHPAIAQPQPRLTKFQFEQNLELGENKPLSREYLIGFTQQVRTDSQGRIYQNDKKIEGIRVYDSEGDYLTTLGRNGRGPGEFVHKTGMGITAGDKLVVHDRMMIRITEFDVSTENPEELGRRHRPFDFPEKRALNTVHILGLGKNGYVNVYRVRLKWPGQPGPSGPKELLHFVSEDWETIVDRAYSYNELGDMQNPYLESMTGFRFATLNITAQNEEKLIIAPYFYEGELHVVEKTGQANWEKTRAIEGFVEEREAFELYANASSVPDYADPAGQNQAAVVNNESIGIFTMPDKSIMHFTYLLYEGERIYFVEQYDADLNLIAYGPISNLKPKQRRSRTWLRFDWIDNKGQFYVVDHRVIDNRKVLRGYIKEVK